MSAAATATGRVYVPSSHIPASGMAPVKSEIKTFVKRTDLLADEVIGASSSSTRSYSSGERPVIIRNYYSSPWWSPWPMYQPVYVVDGGSHGRRDDGDWRFLVGLTAAIFGGIAMFATGRALSRYQDADRELEDNYQFQDRLNTSRYRAATPDDQELLENAKHASDLKSRVCSRIRNSALADLVFRVTALFGCGMALAGAFAAAPAWMTAGTITALVAGGAMLFKWGYESDKYLMQDAHALKAAVRQL